MQRTILIPRPLFRAGILLLAVSALGILIWLYVQYLRAEQPQVVNASNVTPAVTPTGARTPTGAHPGDATLTMQTFPEYGHAPHPDWVSYMVKAPDGRWAHSTVFRVPAYSYIHVTMYEFDGASGLRNPFWAQARGVIGGHITVNGKRVEGISAANASHTWGVVGLGVSVPFLGVADNAPNQCDSAPCSLSNAHTTTTFTFYSGPPGTYHWQCFVPCAAGFYYGFGGPMQAVGWMDGFLRVS